MVEGGGGEEGEEEAVEEVSNPEQHDFGVLPSGYTNVNAAGWLEYSIDVVILRHCVFLPNAGRNLLYASSDRLNLLRQTVNRLYRQSSLSKEHWVLRSGLEP